MAFIQENRASFGQLISGTFAELNQIRKELAIYFGGFFLYGALVFVLQQVLPPLASFGWIVGTIGYFIAQYWLYQVLLRKAGVLEDESRRVFRLFAMAAVIFIPVIFGLNLLFIPGIILGAKWVMAPSFLVSGNPSVLGSMGASWSASSGNTLTLSLAFTVLVIIAFFAIGLISAVSEGLGLSARQTVLFGAHMHIIPILLMGLSMTAFKRLTETTPTLEDVFR